MENWTSAQFIRVGSLFRDSDGKTLMRVRPTGWEVELPSHLRQHVFGVDRDTHELVLIHPDNHVTPLEERHRR